MSKVKTKKSVTINVLSKAPLVSVIMPSYNQRKFIGDAIDSVLGQTYRPLELLVMDGASTDGTVDLLRAYPAHSALRWFSERDSGVVEAVNKGIVKAKGEILAIQSSDDLYAAPDVVAHAVDSFRDHPSAGMVVGNITKLNENDEILVESDFAPYTLENYLLGKTRIPQESCFFKREVCDEVKGWREFVSYAADSDFFLRMSLLTKVINVKKKYALRIMHEGQRYEQKAKIAFAYEKMIRDLEVLWKTDARTARMAEIAIALAKKHYSQSRRESLKQTLAIRRLRGNDIDVKAPVGPYFPGYWKIIKLKNAFGKVTMGLL